MTPGNAVRYQLETLSRPERPPREMNATRVLPMLTLAASAFAADPESIARGRDVFLNNSCVLCHTIRGTVAAGRLGPDLTHVASRRLLASGTIPNTTGHLAGWILNPQNVKEGSKMPPTLLSQPDLLALVAYLQSLR